MFSKLYSYSLIRVHSRSFTLVCFYLSLVSLALQILVFFILLYTQQEGMDHEINILTNSNACWINIFEDTKSICLLGSDLSLSFILFGTQYLNSETISRINITTNNTYCSLLSSRPVILAISADTIVDKRKQFLSKLVEKNFVPTTFYNKQPLQILSELSNVETAIFVQRAVTFQIVILHPREDNTWWFGDIHSDSSFEAKLASLNLSIEHIELMKTEGAIEKFEMEPSLFDQRLMVSKDRTDYFPDINSSKFVECNITRANAFKNQFKPDKSAEALRFRHKVWKVLSKVKTVLDSLGVAFWLSSGTVLGYFRECDVIAHSKDVDIGMWASSYNDQIIPEMHDHGFKLKISLGFPNDSFELSFIDQSGIKLDIFFFYEEDSFHYWNGGTQVKSGKKFKYTFPKFTLCWTLFKDLRLRVPCETEAYVRANYGPNWFTPVKFWDWKTSPYNVRPNGLWKTEQLFEAIKLYT